MSLVFRSVWHDDSVNAVELLDDEFKKWCVEKTGVSREAVPYRGTLTTLSGATLDIRRADTEIGVGLQCVLRESDTEGRQWTTTAIAMTVGTSQTFWVDLDLVTQSDTRLDVAAPRLLRNLLKRSNRPIADGLIIDEKVKMVQPDSALLYATELTRPDRRLPIVTFSPDRKAGPEKTFERAEYAARALAGVAQVFVLSPQAEFAVQRFMPKGFWVYGGAVRLYLPPVDFENSADSIRHPYIARHLVVKHSRSAAAILGRRIAGSNVHPPVPEGWSSLQELLRRPSEQEIREKAEENKSARVSIQRDEIDPSEEVEILELLLAEGDLLRANLESTIKDRDSYIDLLEEQHLDDAAELEWAYEQVETLRRNFALLNQLKSDREVDETTDLESLETPETIEDVIDLAKEVLAYLAIPDKAAQHVESLDEGHKARMWAKTIWDGLVQLNKYASAKSEGQMVGSFRDWCTGAGNWSTEKLSMVESSAVKSNPALWDKRYFPVSTEISKTGRCHMEAHLKIQIGGGNSIPRLYFLDDTDGSTGQVHIGFIGPHYLVPNTKS